MTRIGNAAIGFVLVAALGVSACSKLAPAPEADPAATSSPAAAPSPTETASPVADNAIPDGMHGAWGINAADCDTSRGDAKGNMIIGADQLKFYESVAKLGKIEKVAADAMQAQFAFSGEGQTWQQGMELTLSADGMSLVRRDFGPDAMPEPLTYQRCAQ